MAIPGVGTLLGLAKRGMDIIYGLIRRGERKASEDRGRLQERERQRDAASAARKAMGDVEPSGRGDTVDRLRDAGF